jgi:hypothetical protein
MPLSREKEETFDPKEVGWINGAHPPPQADSSYLLSTPPVCEEKMNSAILRAPLLLLKRPDIASHPTTGKDVDIQI